jgi:hypothetical protein
MPPAQLTERVGPFVHKLRASRPRTPILLAEDSSFRNLCPTEKGRVLREIYGKLTAEGVKGLYFLSSEGMLGEDGEATVDGCHPTDLGMMRQAEVFVEFLRPIVRSLQDPVVQASPRRRGERADCPDGSHESRHRKRRQHDLATVDGVQPGQAGTDR